MSDTLFDLVGELIKLHNEPPEKIGWMEQTTISDAVDAIQRMEKAIKQVIAIVDDMGVMRQELCEESIKELDRRLMDMRYKVSSAESLEEKLALMKDQREMERIRAARRKRLFDVMDNGAIYANDPLPRDELIALVAPLRELVAANAELTGPQRPEQEQAT